MDGNKEVRLVAPRYLGALTVIDVIVAFAHENCFHAGFGIDATGQQFSDRQRNVFFFRPATPYGARVVTAVPGIDGDDNFPATYEAFRRTLHSLQVALPLQIDNESIAIGAIRSGTKTSRSNCFVKIEHDAKLAIRPHAGANALDRTSAGRQSAQRI